MYAEEGKGYCWHLPAGVASVNIVGANRNEVLCPAGTYKGIGPEACTACPKGHYCPSRELPPVKCPPATY